MIQQEQTVKQWLEQVASTDASTEQDSNKMQNLLHRVGFSRAVVVMGIVYVEGQGTVDYPPISIHSMAGVLLKKGQCWNLDHSHTRAYNAGRIKR